MQVVTDLIQKEITESKILYGVSWEAYENLLEKYEGENCPRFTYDSGILEIQMTNSLKHEEDNRNLALLVEQIAFELEIDFRHCGSTTFKRRSVRKGFEPDSGFYMKSLKFIEGKVDLNFEKDPPPDLIIEINRTNSSIPRMPIFAAFGVRELWRFDGENVKFYKLKEGVYTETEKSIALKILSGEKATEFLQSCRKMNSTAWIKSIRNWIKTEKEIS